MNKNLLLILAATAIAVAIWVFFDIKGMPLGSRDTTVVVAVCLLAVLGVRGIWALIRKKKSSKSGNACLWIAVALAASYLPTTLAQSTLQTAVQQTPGNVACTPDAPVAKTGDTIGLSFWALPEANKSPDYKWSVDGGEVEGTGRKVRWRLSGVRPGIHQAKVETAGAESTPQQCTVRLIVVAGDIDLRGGHRASGRAWLLPDQTEDAKFGLRSYVLFGAPPSTDEQRERYLRMMEEYLAFPASEAMEKYYRTANLPLEALNVTYLPLKSKPPETMDSLKSADATRKMAEELLRRYDYERALVILGDLEGEHHQGPYLVSYPEHAGPLDQPYIFQDLSWVPPEVVTLWVHEFLNQAAQERDWSKPKTASFVLKMRTIITVCGTGYDVVQKSVDHLLTYYQGEEARALY